MLKDLESVMFDEKAIAAKVSELGQQITKDYAGKDVLVVGILKGAAVFFTDLIRQINLPINIDFIVASSYGDGTETSGKVDIKKDLEKDIAGRHVILVEDILDTGNTLSYIKEYLESSSSASVRICTLFDKPSRRTENIIADYKGFTIDDVFIVGYGLDYAEKYRNLPYVGVLKPEVYDK